MRLRFSIIAFAAVLAMSLVGVASAVAVEFTDSKPGEILSEVVTGTSGIQKFHTNNGAGLLECTKAHGLGTAAAKSKEQEIHIVYGGCKANGAALVVHNASEGETKKAAGVLYLFLINEEHVEGTETTYLGLVHVLKEIVVEGAENGHSTCFVTVPVQSKLGKIKYKNVGTEIEEITEVSGIESTGHEGSAASCKYATEKVGTYTGNSLIKSLNGGELKAI